MTAPMDSLAEIVETVDEIAKLTAKLERLALHAISETRNVQRQGWTQTGVAGIPCSGEIVREALTHECYVPSPEEKDEPPGVEP